MTVVDATAYTVLLPAREGSRPMDAEVLWSIPRVGAPVPAPRGGFVVVPVTTWSTETNKGASRLWRVPTDGGTPTPLTTSSRKASSPAFDPDGKRIAFVAKDADDDKAVAQIHVLPVDGGEAECLTDMPLGVFDPKWLPDGSGIVFGAWLFEENPSVDETREEAARRKDEPRAVYATEDRMYRFWDAWIAGGTFARYFLLDIASGVVHDLMPDSKLWANWMEPAGAVDIAPEGDEIVFHAYHVGGPENRFRGDVYRLPIKKDGAAPECLTADNPASSNRPRYTPCGAAILYGKAQDPNYYADRARIMRIDRKSLAHDAWLEDWDRAPGGWTFGESSELWFQAEDDGAQHIWRLDLKAARTEGAEPEIVARGGTCGAPRPAADGFVYYTRHDVSRPAEVWRVPQSGGAAERVSSFTDGALEDVAMGEVRDYRYEGAEGEQVQVVVILPPGHEEGAKHPLVHMIHGGPHGQFGDLWHFRWNSHAFAAPGYITACVNFQGSTSWGNDFGQRIQGEWGRRPTEDVERGTDFLIASGLVDETKMAISGGSYGGYLTAWIATQTDRYACAVNHAGVFDLTLQYASDITWGRPVNMGGQIWDKPEVVDRYNPARHTKGLNTPMLVIHGERDYRVPINHAMICYGILQARGIESRLLYFADENHWILKPKNSLRWYQEVLDWFARFLSPPD